MTYYISLIHKEGDSAYGVSFPDLPGVVTASDTLDDALHEASSILAFALEDWEGERPTARTLDELRKDADFMDWSADAVVAAVAPVGSLAQAA